MPHRIPERLPFPLVVEVGSKAKADTHTGIRGEIIYDEDRATLIEHDGLAKGGRPVKFLQITGVIVTPHAVAEKDTWLGVTTSSSAIVVNLPTGVVNDNGRI